MINKKEIPIGSIIHALVNQKYTAVCEVLETYETGCKVRVLRSADSGNDEGFGSGTEHIADYEDCGGLPCYGRVYLESNLRGIGFIESDERSWKLMYYFGDMRLYWKYDKKRHYNTFKFKPDFTQKRWVRIECMYIHSLQNIMRFLTGGEMEFTWQETNEEKGGEV